MQAVRALRAAEKPCRRHRERLMTTAHDEGEAREVPLSHISTRLTLAGWVQDWWVPIFAGMVLAVIASCTGV
jgi:hypothetical protein